MTCSESRCSMKGMLALKSCALQMYHLSCVCLVRAPSRRRQKQRCESSCAFSTTTTSTNCRVRRRAAFSWMLRRTGRAAEENADKGSCYSAAVSMATSSATLCSV
eukprot:2807543-Pleurochrysis_carterae.AAC.4